MRRTAPTFLVAIALASFSAAIGDEPKAGLGGKFAPEDAAKLAKDARESGDPARGALVFFRPSLQCARCHASDDGGKTPTLGPDLATLGRFPSDAHVVESILEPSKAIRKGFEPITIALKDGKTIAGLFAGENTDAILVRDPAKDGAIVAIPRAEIEERKAGSVSLMPAGLVDQLADRGEFLDLVRYIFDISEHGPARALALRPPASAFAAPPLPEYEAKVDHSGMIAGLDVDHFQRGEAIYGRVCANCHGTKETPGSLPTSLRFASGTFKNGPDTFRMYQTLTHGFGQMAPQSWMVPEQKYDVIHYIREAYLRPHNPSQFVPIDRPYLASLPKGDTRGPGPVEVESWVTMDYGPSLTLTCEIGSDGSNFAYKGIATRLDAGPGGISRGRAWSVFEHDTLRVAAAWAGTGFIDWNGINFNGSHGVHPRVVGSVAFANPTSPGWANPETGGFDDPRLKGRDGRPYGPLPRSWGHYRGQYRHGDRVILAYSVGKTDVLEASSVEMDASAPAFGRTFVIGPRDRDMILQVARNPNGALRTIPSADGADRGFLEGPDGSGLLAGISPPVPGIAWSSTPDGDLRLKIPAGGKPLRFTLKVARVPLRADPAALAASIKEGPSTDLASLTKGGPSRWPQTLKTVIKRGNDDGPFAVDVLGSPDANPWNCLMRFSGLDFFPGGDSLVVCTWDGDVWRVDGLTNPDGILTWKRFACGLFQPLGLKVVDGVVHASCRDQIVALRDLNRDGEADFMRT